VQEGGLYRLLVDLVTLVHSNERMDKACSCKEA
jgi:hypothetical protein